jgi:hypothetical protein
MAVTKETGRQYPLYADVTIGFADLAVSATAYEAIDIPDGAIVVSGSITITEVWDSATSDTLDVGDGLDPDRYTPTPLDIDAAANHQALTMTGFKYGAADTIDVTWVGVGAVPSQGSLRLVVSYIRDSRSNENQG